MSWFNVVRTQVGLLTADGLECYDIICRIVDA